MATRAGKNSSLTLHQSCYQAALLRVLAQQYLDRRIASAEELRREVAAGEAERNERAVKVRWLFTTAKSRIKLHRR